MGLFSRKQMVTFLWQKMTNDLNLYMLSGKGGDFDGSKNNNLHIHTERQIKNTWRGWKLQAQHLWWCEKMSASSRCRKMPAKGSAFMSSKNDLFRQFVACCLVFAGVILSSLKLGQSANKVRSIFVRDSDEVCVRPENWDCVLMLCIIIQLKFGALVLRWTSCADFGCVREVTTTHLRVSLVNCSHS